MIHLLIRGIGLCGATGEFEPTLVPDEATCPRCRILIGMACDVRGAAEALKAPKPIARVKLSRRRRRS